MPISRLSAACCVDLEPRPLPSTGVTRRRQYYGPLRHPKRPGQSLTGVRLRVTRPHHLGFPVFRWISLYRHAVVITPVAHWVGSLVKQHIPAVCIAHQRLRPSPSICRVGVHIGHFEACSTFTHVTACLLAASPKRCVYLEGSDGFVTSTAAPIATGWSDPVRQAGIAPAEDPRLSTAHKKNRHQFNSHR